MHGVLQQYEYQTAKDLSLRKFRHDLKNHIGVLRTLLGNNNLYEAEEYIEKIWDVQNEYKARIDTGDSWLDTIVNYYAYIASEKRIDFSCRGTVSSNMNMMDITTLFGNLLQNADYEVLIFDTFRKELLNQNLDILFLDIDFGNSEDGFEIADKFNSLSNETLICFTASHSEFARKGYRYNAFRYIDKENLEEVDAAIDAYLNTMIQEKYISLSMDLSTIVRFKI